MVGHRHASASSRERAQTVAKVLARLRGPRAAQALAGQAQERALIGGADQTLGFLDLQLQGAAGETA